MPGVPSGRACEACRQQKKKVVSLSKIYIRDDIAEVANQGHCDSVTKRGQSALVVSVFRFLALALVSEDMSFEPRKAGPTRQDLMVNMTERK